MNPTRVWARNLRTWRTLDVQLAPGVTAVMGENGAGKSSLLNVLDYALWADGRQLARLLTRDSGETELELGVEFEHDGQTYRVRRSYSSRSGGRSKVDLEQRTHVDGLAEAPGGTWQSLSGETIDATQAALARLLGVTRATWRASSFVAQGDGDAFTSATPGDRKAILTDALGLDVYDLLLEQARADRTEHARQHAEHAADELRLREQLEQLGDTAALLEAARVEHDTAKQARDTAADDHRQAAELLATATGRQQARAAAADRVAAATEADRRLAVELATLDDVDEHRLALSERVQRGELAQRVSRARTALLQLEGDVADAKREELDRRNRAAAARNRAAEVETVAAIIRAGLELGAATCDACGQPLAGDALATWQQSRRAELERHEKQRDRALDEAAELDGLAADAAARAAASDPQLEHARHELDTANALLPAEVLAHDLDRVAADGAAAMQERVELAARVQQLDELKGRRAAARDTLAAAQAELEQLPAAMDVDELGRAEALAAGIVRATATRHEQAVADLARREAAHEQAQALAVRVVEANAAAKRAREQLDTCERLEQAFGRNGIPALILEHDAIPHLETEAARIVEQLGRPYTFELRTQRATKSGTTRETLDVIVHTPTGEADYADFSGGERTRIDLALRLALAQLLATRAAGGIRCLAIDEPAHLDEQGFEQLARVLAGMGGTYDRVLVVSHHERLRDAFDSVLRVEGGADSGEPSRLAA